MSQLRVYKNDGSLLFDTNYISYGLIKSGWLAFQGGWTRKTLKSAQLDPNNGANWTTTNWVGDTSFADGIWGFTVWGAISPIVFITGSGCLVGSAVSGNAITFYYTNASTNTRFYCFDWMADSGGSPYLKTYATDGRLTFNSLMPPLNIIAAVQAPGPGGVDQYGRYTTCYGGGANRVRQAPSGAQQAQIDSFIDIGLGGEEYAAYLPWSRSVGIADMLSGGVSFFRQYTGSEGAYGWAGGISFMFGATGGTTQANPSNQGWGLPCSFYNLPTDRYPVALVIRTSSYPMPYN